MSGTVDNDFRRLSLGCCKTSTDVDVATNCSGKDSHTQRGGGRLHLSHMSLPTRDRSVFRRSVFATLLAIFVFIFASYFSAEKECVRFNASAKQTKKMPVAIDFLHRLLEHIIIPMLLECAEDRQDQRTRTED